MASEATRGAEDDESRRHQLIETITSAVLDEDYDFMLEVASQQSALRPFELAEYMNVKRQNSEDPVEERRWGDGVRKYVNSLAGQEFPVEEVEAINSVIQSLEFDEITSNKETAEEPAIELTSEEVERFNKDDFTVRLTQEEIDHIGGLPIFQQARSYAIGDERGPKLDPLKDAVNLIKKSVEGALQVKMLQVLDWYVFQQARSYAIGDERGPKLDPLKDAVKACKDYASDEEAEDRMRSALDKEVFSQACAYARGDERGPKLDPIKDAKDTVENYASTPGRRDAMLRRLGFL